MKRPAKKIDPPGPGGRNQAAVLWGRNGYRIVRSPMALYVEKKGQDAVGAVAWGRLGDWMLGATDYEYVRLPTKLIEALLLSAVGEEALD
jgi:hypothetical protein